MVMSMPRRENHPLPQIFKGCQERTGRWKRCSTLLSTEPYLGAIPFQGVSPSIRKENSSHSPHQRLLVHLRYRRGQRPRGSPAISRFQFENINPIPFRERAPSRRNGSAHLLGVNPSLRTDSPMSNYCSHGTFLHFSLHSSHLNIC